MASKTNDKLANYAIISDLLNTYMDYNQKERQMFQNAKTTKRQIVKGKDGFNYYADNMERVVSDSVMGDIPEKADSVPMSFKEFELSNKNPEYKAYLDDKNATKENQNTTAYRNYIQSIPKGTETPSRFSRVPRQECKAS